FYPPASWTLGGLISAALPWAVASPVYIWNALVAAGSSMFALARRWFRHSDALFCALFYVLNPYHLVIVYWRSAFAELLAASLVPLLLLALLNVEENDWSGVPGLSFVLAASWLTNAPAAVMIHYSAAILLSLLACQGRSLRLLWRGGLAVALGGC